MQNNKQNDVIKGVQENRITLVEAAPGTGKTYTAVSLSMKVAKDLAEKNSNTKILILTFSKNARAQIVKQLENLDDHKLNYKRYIEITNYHSFYQKYIWNFSMYLGLPSNISIMAPIKRKAVISEFLQNNGIDNPSDDQVMWAMDLLEGDVRPTSLKKLNQVKKIIHLKELIIEYIKDLNRSGEIYFSDFGYYMNKLLSSSKQLLNILQRKYELIVLDEYQDSSDIQDSIVKKLIGINNKAIFFADSKQMIYQWRGAKSTRIEELINYYDNEINYITLTDVYRYKNNENLLNLINDARSGIFNKEDIKNKNGIKVIDVEVKENSINLYSNMIKNKCYSKMKYAVLNELKKHRGKTVGILAPTNEIVDYLQQKFAVEFGRELSEINNNEEEHNFITQMYEFLINFEFNDIDELTKFLLWLTFQVTYEKSFGKIKKSEIKEIEFNDISRIRHEVIKKVKEEIEGVSDLDTMRINIVDYLLYLKKTLKVKRNLINIALKVIKIKELSLEKVSSVLLQYQYNNSFRDLNGEYILNIHQSKGREFDIVFIVDSNSIVNDKNLLYVALSRVKEEVVLFDWKAIGS